MGCIFSLFKLAGLARCDQDVEATEQPHADLTLLGMCILWPRVWLKLAGSSLSSDQYISFQWPVAPIDG